MIGLKPYKTNFREPSKANFLLRIVALQNSEGKVNDFYLINANLTSTFNYLKASQPHKAKH